MSRDSANLRARDHACQVSSGSLPTHEGSEPREPTTERETVARDQRAGRSLLDANLKDVKTTTLEIDELWSFVGKKERRLSLEEKATRPDLGDNYIFVAIDRQTKLVVCHRIGKRTPDTANIFTKDVRRRIQ